MKVSPHTSLKHRMLGLYFKICRQIMTRRTLYYVDLYAGDGECECDEAPLKRWECPFIRSLLKRAETNKLKLYCFLNDLDPENEGTYEKLKSNVAPYAKFIRSLTKDDANKAFEGILLQIPKDEWSIFFLDPFKHSDLNWKTIEGISKHEGYDSWNKCVRKPELIINLMTHTMQRSIESDPESITRALGTDGWKEMAARKGDKRLHEVFYAVFANQLESLGYNVTSFCITQTLPNTNVLYYLIFASTIPNANEIITKRYKPSIDKLMNEKWNKENFTYRMVTKAKKRGIKTLDQFDTQD